MALPANLSYCFPPSEFRSRTRKLQALMAPAGLDAIVLAQSADLYYFTGTIQSGLLYVPGEGEPVYFVRRDATRARRESPLEQIVAFRSMKEVLAGLSNLGIRAPRSVGYELDVLPVAFHERYRQTFGAAQSVDASPLVRRTRMFKSELEIVEMRRATDQADRIFQAACKLLRVGMTELELAAELEHQARVEGHPGLVRMRSFNGAMLYAHIISGPDSALPSHLDTPLGGAGPHASFGQGAGHRRIQAHEPVIVDWGGSVNGYLADQTRILSVGELPIHLRRAYADMLEVQALMLEIVRPGVSWGEVYDRCLELAHELGHAERFMGAKGSQVSFIGHGLGIEIDEPPYLARGFTEDFLATGMTFAFEPKVVFLAEGAIGIENTWVLRETGPERLTHSVEALAVV
jgi:Xaa-Pro dipeptidase